MVVWGIMWEMKYNPVIFPNYFKNHEIRMKSYETPTAFHGKSLFWVFVSVAENLGEKTTAWIPNLSPCSKGGRLELPVIPPEVFRAFGC